MYFAFQNVILFAWRIMFVKMAFVVCMFIGDLMS